MPLQVTRTDTGQFVLMDPATDTVIIEDDLAVGFAKIEEIVAEAPARASGDGAAGPDHRGGGGPRYAVAVLAVVVPFLWLAVFYFALGDLLADHALSRQEARETQAQIEALERELQALRSEIAGAPRAPKAGKRGSKPKQGKPQSAPATKPPDAEPSTGGSGARPPGADPKMTEPAKAAPAKPGEGSAKND